MARLRLDKLLVVDFESTCWQDAPPPGERSEIIEIGIAELCLEDTPRLLRSAGYLVRPKFSTLSSYCTELTGITQSELRKQGRGLPEICNRIRNEFGGGAKTWAAWGRDNEDIARDCAALGIASPFSESFLNLGHLWSLVVGAKRPVGLMAAMNTLELSFDGRPHRAEPDAVNTGRLALSLVALVRSMIPTESAEHMPRIP